MIHFHIISIFPDTIKPYLDESILGRAQKNKKIKISYYNPRDFTKDKHKKARPTGRSFGRVDAPSYGGGPGMVMLAEPILRAVKKAKGTKKKVTIILFSPRGKKFTSKDAQKYSKQKDIILICGRYEGTDARIEKILRPQVVSVGDYVLTGGELPATIVVDAVSRHIKGVLGDKQSLEEKRVAGHDVYTRPQDLVWNKKKYSVPEVLVSGHHKNIEEFRKKGKK